jgi:EmrB/QacA subfamily drug resistance transporter
MADHEEGLKPKSPFFFLNELKRPDAIREWPHAPWLAVVAVGLGALMSQIDASIVSLAFPTLQQQFHVSLGAITWIGLSYLLTVVSTLVVFGRISDMAGRKLIYVYGFVVFLVGSLLCGTAPTLTVLLASRVLQAIGGAMIQANSVAIVVLSLPPEKRTKGLGFQAAAQAMGLALGPTIGGVLVGLFSWRWLFLVNIPVGLVALPAAMAFIPRSRQLAEPRRLDWAGSVLLGLSVVGILGAFSFAGTLGWTSTAVLGGFGVGIASGVAFFAHERRTRDPLISPAMLGDSRIRLGLGAASAGYFALFAFLLVVPFEVERGLSRGPAVAGVVLLALPLAIGVTAPFAGRATRALGHRRTAVVACVLAASGTVVSALSSTSMLVLAAGLAVVGIGLGFFNTVNNASVMAAIPAQQAAVGSGLLNTTRGIGTASGLAIGGAIFVGLGGADAVSSSVRSAFEATSLVVGAMLLVAGVMSWRAGEPGPHS